MVKKRWWVWCKLSQWKSPIGYILELDLEYPDDLHVLHNDYPLAPEKIGIPYDMSSDFCKKFADKYEIKVGYVRKLIPNLGSKTKYVLHYRDLPLYLSLGMKLTKIHRMLKFKQSDWMKKYIDFNTEKAKKLIVLIKIFSNWWLIVSVKKQQKTCEKKTNVRLVTKEKDF